MRSSPLVAHTLAVVSAFGIGAAHAEGEGRIPTVELEKLLAGTDDLARTVSELRGLPIKQPIARGVTSKEQVTKRLIELLDQDYAPGELESEDRALKRFGLLPVDRSYRQIMLDVLTEQIAGFYDPHTKQLYIADWIDPSMQRIVLAHEIDHALQDQSFDLLKFIKPNVENGDEQLARQSLAEGDGVAVMIEIMFREQGTKFDPWASDMIVNSISSMTGLSAGKQLASAPLFIRETVLFPYSDGLRFIAASRRTRPWSAIDDVFRKPPLSTEHILHPAKYRSYEKPLPVKIVPLPSLATWTQTFTNVMGEFGFRIFLRQNGVEQARAERAAAGWGGDRTLLFQPADNASLEATVGVIYSTWDAEMDAIEAQEAMADALLVLTGAEKAAEKTKVFARAAGKDGAVSFVERRGRDVLLVVAAPPAVAATIRTEAWRLWRSSTR